MIAKPITPADPPAIEAAAPEPEPALEVVSAPQAAPDAAPEVTAAEPDPDADAPPPALPPDPDDPLERLYGRKQLNFIDGAPAVTVRLMEGQKQVGFVPKGRMRLLARGGLEKKIEAAFPMLQGAEANEAK